MYPTTLPIPVVPSNSAPGALQAFNNAEVQVQGITPYGYGMPRYGPAVVPVTFLFIVADIARAAFVYSNLFDQRLEEW
ncbi:hypothetical protein QFC21_004619 [Naganishia friedmannii]|uniref:Uncharacterized protein n=1 Tax=Naganishia friedmannii TaxID=89922 RepID=A0ACC2VDW1_9TREE|nr:hypothetical protein QFC21_004619 [Naganishia friedmannii]